MTDQSDGYSLGDWFRCPDCGEGHEGLLQVKQFLAFGNVSMKLRCRACGFVYEQRDWRTNNLNSRLRRKRWFLESFLTHPRGGSTIHDAAQCADCTARGHVVVEVECEERGEYRDTFKASVVRLRCEDCGATHTSEITH